MKISANFSAEEFACHCGCGFGLRPGDVSSALVEQLERARAHFGEPVTVVSGCRCAKHNRAVGGATHSQHMDGIAADIKIAGVNPSAVADYFEREYPTSHGIGRYKTWVHFDVRASKARWRG